MKQIYIFSDTHNRINDCAETIRNAEKADAVIHAGDYADDARDLQRMFPNIPFYCVKGNGDYFSHEPSELTVIIDGIKIFITHGHMYNVKYEYDLHSLNEKGRSAGAKLIVFGHTHKPYIDVQKDITTVNPGSSGYGGTYAVLKTDGGRFRVDILEFE